MKGLGDGALEGFGNIYNHSNFSNLFISIIEKDVSLFPYKCPINLSEI